MKNKQFLFYTLISCFVFILSNQMKSAICKSLGSGDWTDVTKWSCGAVQSPLPNDLQIADFI